MRVNETLDLNIPGDSLNVDRMEQHLAKEMATFGKRAFG